VNREPHRGLLEWYQRLIRLRRTSSALTDGRMTEVCVAADEGAGWLVVERGPVTVAANLAQVPRRLPVRAGRPSALLLGSEPGIALQPGGVDLPAESVAIIGEPAGGCGA
jgi:maltooligosyltrehalose trehalohydrolase